MRHFTFEIALDREQIMLIYQGQAKRLIVSSEQGLTLELSVDKLRPFVTHSGVQGYFQLQVADDYRFISLKRLR